jgi:lysophospholipase L1-like esterase
MRQPHRPFLPFAGALRPRRYTVIGALGPRLYTVIGAFWRQRELVLALLCALAASGQIAPPASPALDLSQWEPEIRAFQETDRQSPPPTGGIVFAGSSSIRLWKTLAGDFAGLPVLNRGFGGSQIREVTAFADRMVIPYRPRLIVFYCGSNDVVSGRAVPDVVGDLQAFVRKIHAALPQTRLIYISIAPNPARWHLKDAWLDLNERIRAYTRTDGRLSFVDIWGEMLGGASGEPRPELFVDDQLHMNERGYAIWARVLRPVVEKEFNALTPTTSRDASAADPGDQRSGSRR